MLASNLQHVNLKSPITSWLQKLDNCFFCAKMQALMPKWDKCLNFSGNYVKA